MLAHPTAEEARGCPSGKGVTSSSNARDGQREIRKKVSSTRLGWKEREVGLTEDTMGRIVVVWWSRGRESSERRGGRGGGSGGR
jgi:hypothetical protein